MKYSDFFRDKTVFITGHTGFVGSWLSKVLITLGANVIGYSLDPPSNPNLFQSLDLDKEIDNGFGDILDFEHLERSLTELSPEIVFHLAAQPIVLDSIDDPRSTFNTNVVGTVNVLDAVRRKKSVKAVIVMTSDKVYLNKNLHHPFRETDEIGGKDPYSASKGCQEIVVNSFWQTHFKGMRVGLASVRAGNIIGGGDWGHYRLVPDVVMSMVKDHPLLLRNPNSVRPWQHVLDPISAMLNLATKLTVDPLSFSGAWNIGPIPDLNYSVKDIAGKLSKYWGKELSVSDSYSQNLESEFLSLDISKASINLEYQPRYNITDIISKTVDWYKGYYIDPKTAKKITEMQIKEYFDVV